jgi:hypothetical protein
MHLFDDRLSPRARRAVFLIAVAICAGVFAGTARAAQILDANDATFSGSIPIGPENQAGEQQTAQIFTAQNTGTVNHIDVRLYRWNAFGDLHVRLTGTSGGQPSGPALAEATLPNSAMPNGYGWVTVTFPTSVTLTAGTSYALLLGVTDASDGSTFPRWATDYNGPVQQAYYYWSYCGCYFSWGGQNANYQVWLNGTADTTLPAISVSHTADGLAGWNVTSPVSVSVTASDSDSGLAGNPACTVDGSPVAVSGSGGSYTLPVSGQGSHSISCSVSDAAGNANSGTDTVKIDTVAPSLSVSHTADGLAGWNVTSPVSVSVATSEAGSGLAGDPACSVDASPAAVSGGGGSYTLPVSGQGSHSISCSVSDAAGNSNTSGDTVTIDTSAPTISVSHIADGLAGWNVTSPVSVSVATSDSGSGLAGPACTVDGSPAAVSGGGGSYTLPVSGQGSHSISCSVSDAAGNSNTGSDAVTIDTLVPTITYTGNAGTYALGANVSILCAAADSTPGSGLQPNTCSNVVGPAWSFGPGSHTVSASATDNAGNTGSGSATFTVNVTASGVCALTRAWSTNAGIANALCEQLGVGNSGAKRPNVEQFDRLLAAQTGKSFTASQATQLRAFADTLA